MKTVCLKLFDSGGLSEIFQSIDLKFSFVRKLDEDSFKQLHNHAKCRDFLGDVIWSNKTGNNVGIYSFYYKKPGNEIDADKTRLSLRFPDGESEGNFMANLHFLQEKEANYGLSQLVVFKTQVKHHWIIEADSDWQSNLWKISLFTFYIKLLSYKTPKEAKEPENEYLADLTPKKEHKLMSHIKVMFDEKFGNGIYEVHNNSGFHSLLNGNLNDTTMQKIVMG